MSISHGCFHADTEYTLRAVRAAFQTNRDAILVGSVTMAREVVLYSNV